MSMAKAQKLVKGASEGPVASSFLKVRPFAEAKVKVEGREQRDLFGEYVQRRRVAAATEGGGALGAGGPARALVGHAVSPLGTQALQRTALTVEEAEEVLKHNAHGIWSVDHQITEPADEADFNLGNCHGYMKTGQHPVNSDPYTAIGVALRAGKNIGIFYRAGNIDHSGIMDGNNLYHYVKGVGVVFSPNSATQLFGYDKRYNLPEAKGTWIDENNLSEEEVAGWGDEFTPEQQKLVDHVGNFLHSARWESTEIYDLYSEWEDLQGTEILAFIEKHMATMKEAGLKAI